MTHILRRITLAIALLLLVVLLVRGTEQARAQKPTPTDPHLLEIINRVRQKRADAMSEALTSFMRQNGILPDMTGEDKFLISLGNRGGYVMQNKITPVVSRFTLNRKISGLSIEKVYYPDLTVAFYERDPGPDSTRILVFVNGKVKKISEAAWQSYRKKEKLPENFAPLPTQVPTAPPASASPAAETGGDGPPQIFRAKVQTSALHPEQQTDDSGNHFTRTIKDIGDYHSSDLKQVSMALMMYVQDYDERLPDAANTEQITQQLQPYYKRPEMYSLFTGLPYLWNTSLKAVTQSGTENVIAFYEPIAGLDGKRSVGYLDGSVYRLTETQFQQAAKDSHLLPAGTDKNAPLWQRAELMRQAGEAFRQANPDRAIVLMQKALALCDAGMSANTPIIPLYVFESLERQQKIDAYYATRQKDTPDADAVKPTDTPDEADLKPETDPKRLAIQEQARQEANRARWHSLKNITQSLLGMLYEADGDYPHAEGIYLQLSREAEAFGKANNLPPPHNEMFTQSSKLLLSVWARQGNYTAADALYRKLLSGEPPPLPQAKKEDFAPAPRGGQDEVQPAGRPHNEHPAPWLENAAARLYAILHPAPEQIDTNTTDTQDRPSLRPVPVEDYVGWLYGSAKNALALGDTLRAVSLLDTAFPYCEKADYMEPQLGKEMPDHALADLRGECLSLLMQCYIATGREDNAAALAPQLQAYFRQQQESQLEQQLLFSTSPEFDGFSIFMYEMRIGIQKFAEAPSGPGSSSRALAISRISAAGSADMTAYLPEEQAWYAVRLIAASVAEGDTEGVSAACLQITEKFGPVLGENHTALLVARVLAATAELAQGHPAAAAPLLTAVVPAMESAHLQDSPYYAQALLQRGLLEAANGRPEEAAQALNQCLAAQQKTLDRLLANSSEQAMRDYLATLRPAFDTLWTVGLSAPDSPAINTLLLEWTLRRKAVLLDTLSRFRQAQTLAAQEPAVAEKMRTLRAAQQMLADLQAQAAQHKTPDAVLLTQIAAADAEAEKAQAALNQALSQQHPLAGQTVTFAALRDRLPAGSALVEFVRVRPYDLKGVTLSPEQRWLPARYAALVVTPDSASPRRIDLGPAAPIEDAIRQVRGHLETGARGIVTAHFPQPDTDEAETAYRADALLLTQKVFAPLTAALGGAKSLYLAPDGELNRIPFEALTADGTAYLIETYRLSYLSSGKDLLRPAAPVGKGTFLFTFPDYDMPADERTLVAHTELQKLGVDAPPAFHGAHLMLENAANWPALPGTRSEGEAARDALTGSAFAPVRLFMGRDALEDVVRAVVSPRILHIATHGFYLPDTAPAGRAHSAENPLLRSGVVLAGANTAGEPDGPNAPEDGWLTAEEAAQMRLSGTELVTLSACETGLGDVSVGEGVYGLRRAFLLAGAQCVLTSLFPVPDSETALLMQGFYSRMQAGSGSKRDALRDTQLALLRQRRESGRNAHPYYWAGFVLVGDR